jgi:D-alanine-D-alanine ligase
MTARIQRGARVGVLMGGLSSEREVSLDSGAAVAGALRRRGWDVVEIDVGRDVAVRLQEAQVDACWIALHGNYGEDGCVQGLLEILGIPYTGSGPKASAAAMDKAVTKRLLADTDVPLPNDFSLWPDDVLPDALRFPVVAKTPCGGSTIGTYICQDRAQLAEAIDGCRSFAPEVLLEQFIEGVEITVALLEGRSLPVVAIRPESGFFDFEAKYTKGKTRYIVPADISEASAEAAQRYAEISAQMLGLTGLCRADFIVDDDDVPWFLEVNTIPGMTALSLSPMAAGAEGIGFDELVERLLLSSRLHLSAG